MKRILLLCLLIHSLGIHAQNCTDESVRNEPGRFLDNHTGKKLGGSAYTTAQKAQATKLMQDFENVCKKNISQFTGGQAKSSFFGLSGKMFYGTQLTYERTYNLGFHEFVCHVQSRQLKIVDEYQGVLRINGNPDFRKIFENIDQGNPLYRQPMNSPDVNAPMLAVFEYMGFEHPEIVESINKSNGYFDATEETVGGQGTQLLKTKNGGGLAYSFEDRSVDWSGYTFRHWFFTHTDIPFLIPVSRKEFLQAVLEYYEREKIALTDNMQKMLTTARSGVAEMEKNKNPYLQNQKDRLALLEKSAGEIPIINEQKKATAKKLLSEQDEKWLNSQVIIQHDNKAFRIPSDPKRDLSAVYGKFYFTDFYTGTYGYKLYRINPEYLKKYPANGPKPAVIEVMYRYSTLNKFTLSVRDKYINNLDFEGIRKLL